MVFSSILTIVLKNEFINPNLLIINRKSEIFRKLLECRVDVYFSKYFFL